MFSNARNEVKKNNTGLARPKVKADESIFCRG
jgi:hypothetical protein